jgi:hypothetical protein
MTRAIVKRLTQIAALQLVFLSCAVSSAQNPLDELYGKGVHAYFANNPTLAAELLTQAIDSGSQDPRAYYFRGLALASQGDSYAGQADYERGAELEASKRRSNNIGKALERIQGAQRREIEKARQNARVNWQAQQAAMQQLQMKDSATNGRMVPPSNFNPANDGLMDGQPSEMKKSDAVPEIDIVPGDDGMGDDSDNNDKSDDDGFGMDDEETKTDPKADDKKDAFTDDDF